MTHQKFSVKSLEGSKNKLWFKDSHKDEGIKLIASGYKFCQTESHTGTEYNDDLSASRSNRRIEIEILDDWAESVE